ncbi:MAG TPA: hypothetical protein PKD96_00060 [Candidatus Absconditabacterales bacterium]|nr:hypothetical protein [Candidatus Absconditabacterales bacterium]HMT26675.1 hypothetical protein [Candidatus Absconditabacterales bacterium]
MISSQQIEKLEKLCAIKLTNEEKIGFMEKLEKVIEMISTLQSVELPALKNEGKTSAECIFPEIEKRGESELLLNNVKHQIIHNSIVIKSSLTDSN